MSYVLDGIETEGEETSDVYYDIHCPCGHTFNMKLAKVDPWRSDRQEMQGESDA